MHAIYIGSSHCSVRHIISDKALNFSAIIHYYQTTPFSLEIEKENSKNSQIDFLTFTFKQECVQQQWNVRHHKMDESSSILFGLSCSNKIKCIQKF